MPMNTVSLINIALPGVIWKDTMSVAQLFQIINVRKGFTGCEKDDPSNTHSKQGDKLYNINTLALWILIFL